MRIALHDSLTLADGDMTATIAACAQEAGFGEAEIVPFRSAMALVDEMSQPKSRVYDLLVAPFQLPDSDIGQTLEELRVELPLIYSVAFDNGIEHAAQAAIAGVDSYLLQPVSTKRLEQELARLFDSIKRLHAASLITITSVGERRIPYHSVFYCETSGHDQILHLEDGRTLPARCSSQAMFDLLSADGRFFKVGSSYIVNLNEVLEAHTPSGTLTLSTGDKLVAPFRVRKPLERTLLEWSQPAKANGDAR